MAPQRFTIKIVTHNRSLSTVRDFPFPCDEYYAIIVYKKTKHVATERSIDIFLVQKLEENTCPYTNGESDDASPARHATFTNICHRTQHRRNANQNQDNLIRSYSTVRYVETNPCIEHLCSMQRPYVDCTRAWIARAHVHTGMHEPFLLPCGFVRFESIDLSLLAIFARFN